jgi:hypothetical protein
MATSGYNVQSDLTSRAAADEPVEGLGWVSFAAIMLGLAGTFNVIDAIVALTRSKFYVHGAVFVFSDLRTWAWIVLLLGVVQLMAAFAVFTGSQFARWFGITAAGINAIGQLLFLPAYPLWSMALFAVDILIIFALCAYAGPRLRNA